MLTFIDELDTPVPYARWSKVVRDVLLSYGVKTWGDLILLEQKQLLLNKSVGRVAVDFIEEEVKSRGWALAKEATVFRNGHQPVQSWTGVYFLQCQDYVKIGHAGNVPVRVSNIATGLPFVLTLIATQYVASMKAAKTLERTLHKQFSVYRVRREWFELRGDLTKYIVDLRTRKTP